MDQVPFPWSSTLSVPGCRGGVWTKSHSPGFRFVRLSFWGGVWIKSHSPGFRLVRLSFWGGVWTKSHSPGIRHCLSLAVTEIWFDLLSAIINFGVVYGPLSPNPLVLELVFRLRPGFRFLRPIPLVFDILSLAVTEMHALALNSQGEDWRGRLRSRVLRVGFEQIRYATPFASIRNDLVFRL